MFSPSYAFQAFGQGQRSCIGMRFALLEAKVAVLSVLRKYSFMPGTKTKEPLVIDAKNKLGWVVGGLWANVEARDHCHDTVKQEMTLSIIIN